MAKQIQRGIVSVRAETDVKALIEGVQTAFHAFKEANDKEIAAIKAGLPTSDHQAKIEKIDADVSKFQAAIDEVNTKIAAAQMNGVSQVKDKEYTDSFKAHMKRGEVQAALNKGAADEGGYLAPTEWDRTITDKLIEVSPMRAIATVQTISGNGFTKLFNLRGTASGWVGEAAARPQTNTAEFGSLTYATGEIYANPAATQQILDDSEINLESWLAGEVQTEFSYQEGVAFLSGDGTNKPSGLLTYITGGAKAAAHPFGAITTVNSGAAAALTSGGIIDLIYALPTEFTSGARFIMNRNTIAAVRKLVDGAGNYLWQPSYQAGQPASLAGYPLTEMAGMPDIAAGAKAIVFGDFKRGYLIVDRAGVRVLRDPYSNKPYVHFYTTKRVGGGVLNPEAMKAITVAASA